MQGGNGEGGILVVFVSEKRFSAGLQKTNVAACKHAFCLIATRKSTSFFFIFFLKKNTECSATWKACSLPTWMREMSCKLGDSPALSNDAIQTHLGGGGSRGLASEPPFKDISPAVCGSTRVIYVCSVSANRSLEV